MDCLVLLFVSVNGIVKDVLLDGKFSKRYFENLALYFKGNRRTFYINGVFLKKIERKVSSNCFECIGVEVSDSCRV